MKKLIYCIVLFACIQIAKAQQNNNNQHNNIQSNVEQGLQIMNNSSNELVKINTINLVSFKTNLLHIIQQEYCFWTDPKNRIETDYDAVEKVKAYWAAINIYPSTKEIKKYSWQERNPWSAAFISWCMKNAGIAENFLYAPNHAKYIVWAKENRLQKKYDNPFWAYTTNEAEIAWPQPGDLFCKNRSGKKYSLFNIHETAISHCDIVLEVDKPNGIVTMIGGNVLDKVNKRWVFLDTNGFIDRNASWLCFDANGIATFGDQKDFFSIIKVRGAE